MIKNTDKAYIAGYIDGDGCFSIYKAAKKFPAILTISSVHKEVLEKFKGIFGGGICSTQKIPKQKQVFIYWQRKRKSLQFVKSILNYLVERQEEARIYIAFIESQSTAERTQLIEDMQVTKKTTNLITRDLKEKFESVRSSIEPTEEDFAYLAGFIDAECCFGISRYTIDGNNNYLYKASLTCNNSKSPNFKWLLERFGGTVNFIDRRTKNPNHRDQFIWRINGNNLFKILDRILPYLVHKKPVCEEIMKFSKTILKNGGARHTDVFRRHYADVLKIREACFHKVHILNLKGTSV